MARRSPAEPFERVGLLTGGELNERPVEPFARLRKPPRVGLGNFRADRVTTPADGRAQHRDHAFGMRAEGHLHPAERLRGDPPERAAPSGVHRGHGVPPRVHQKNGNAVGGLHAEQNPRRVRDGRIALWRPGGSSFQYVDDVGVDLPQGQKLHPGGAQRPQQLCPVGLNVLASVPLGESQVEHAPAIEPAHATRACREAVHQPG